jgi:hypothetical protein
MARARDMNSKAITPYGRRRFLQQKRRQREKLRTLLASPPVPSSSRWIVCRDEAEATLIRGLILKLIGRM